VSAGGQCCPLVRTGVRWCSLCPAASRGRMVVDGWAQDWWCRTM
jgi:hypothetical protein